jgi:hypothetical protein
MLRDPRLVRVSRHPVRAADDICDWHVYPEEFAAAVPKIIDEMSSDRDLIINLDLGGLLRVTGAALRALDHGDADAFAADAIRDANARRLDLT